MNQKENIVLIGMSGAGKSTLGVLLAKALGKAFTDTDLLIQEDTGSLLQELIDRAGVAAFLATEEAVVSHLQLQNTVIATGGSVVYSDSAMQALRKNGRVIYLKVAYEELATRLSNITTRGIVFRNAQDLRGVYDERLPLYERYADLCIDCTGRDIESSVSEILEALKEQKECGVCN